MGQTICSEGVNVNTSKTQTLADWKEFETVKDVMSFLGFCGYFRRHIKHFSQLAKPLEKLVTGMKYKTKSRFGPPVKQTCLYNSIKGKWTPECQKSREY